MLQLQNINVTIDDKTIITDLSMSFEQWKNYCILGKNGSWKSSLALTTMGHPHYEITGGDILLSGESILEREPHERAKAGIFLAFQSIPSIKGVKLFEFLRTTYNARFDTDEKFVWFKKIIVPLMEELDIDTEFLRRELNVWFSGGERRKIEVLQIRLLQPTYIFLDEIDSGLDVDAFRNVATLLQQLDSDEVSFIIITHYFTITDYLPIDHVYLLEQWSIREQGDAQLITQIQENGFA